MPTIKKTITLVLILILLNSCKSVDKTASYAQRRPVDNISSHIDLQINDMLSFNADVYLPDNLIYWEAPHLKAQFHVPDKELMFKKFIGNKKVISKTVNDIVPIGENDKQYVYFTEDGVFVVGGAECSYTTYLSGYQSQLVYGPFQNVEQLYNINKFENQPSLPFLEQETALSMAHEIFQEAGLVVSKDYHLLTFEHSICQSEEKKRVELSENNRAPNSYGSYRTRWGEEDDTYFFTFRQSIGGWNIANQGLGRFDDGALLEPSFLDVGISKSGYSSFNAYNAYKVIEESPSLPILDFHEAVEKVKDIHSKIYTGAYDTIIEIRLQYQPTYLDNSHQKFMLIPVWSYRIHRVYDDGDNRYFHEEYWIHISAYDGTQVM